MSPFARRLRISSVTPDEGRRLKPFQPERSTLGMIPG